MSLASGFSSRSPDTRRGKGEAMAEAPGGDGRRFVVRGIPVLVVAALLATGAGLMAVLVAAHGSELGPPAKLFVLAGLMAASYRMTGWVSTRLHTPVWQTDAAIVAAALVLLEPVGVVVAVTAGVLVGCLLDRRSLAAVVGMVSNSFAMSAATTTIVFMSRRLLRPAGARRGGRGRGRAGRGRDGGRGARGAP